MTTYGYITLQNSTGGASAKKFRTAFEGYRPIEFRQQQFTDTLNGKTHVAQSGNRKAFRYVLRVRETESEAGYGSLSDLRTFWTLNNPNGSPSDVISLTTNFGGSAETVYFEGEYMPAPMSVTIEGSEAWYMVPVTFRGKL